MRGMGLILEAVLKACAVGASVATVVLMLALCGDLATRWMFSRSLPGMIELSETMLTTLIFLSIGYVGFRRSHICMSLLTDALPGRARSLVRALAETITTVFLLWMLYATGLRAIRSFTTGEYKFGLLEFPVWPARWVLTFGVALAAMASAWLVARHLRDVRRGGPGADDEVGYDEP